MHSMDDKNSVWLDGIFHTRVTRSNNCYRGIRDKNIWVVRLIVKSSSLVEV